MARASRLVRIWRVGRGVLASEAAGHRDTGLGEIFQDAPDVLLNSTLFPRIEGLRMGV